ncbi:MAG: hypothetical protein EZS28_007411 [Streblomastix strix]|uniref:Uncharacterized protein n=1 Tax=Streblomastix strix TaxID=222440 RepID=A0A5J4WR46_9EUKA|nr:MAG: hypothetical protein EZS28_007411 [Streblomastix strix]
MYDPILQAPIVTDITPQGWGSTLELDSGEVLVAHEIRYLYSSIRFRKAESNRHFSTRSEGNLPHLPTSEHKNSNLTCTGKDKHNSRRSQQTVQIRRLSSSSILSRSNMNDMEHPSNSRSVGNLNNQTVDKIRYSEHKRLTCLMD